MNWALVCRLLGSLCLLIGGSMVASLPWSFPSCGQTAHYERDSFAGMLQAIMVAVAGGATLRVIGRGTGADSLLRKEALAVVGVGWVLCGILGGLPYLLTPTYRLPGVPMSVCDALFESLSGFTTTGASVLTQLEIVPDVGNCEIAAQNGVIAYIPRSVLFWRCFTHWLGGMGIIVLFVAILGQLGAGGKALMRREVPGPLTDTVRPRIRDTALLMWTIYLGLSVVLAMLLLFQGMDIFESLCHTFGTMATGGFSTRNSSVGTYDSVRIEVTIIVFMMLAGTNFNLYYLLVRRTSERAHVRFQDRIVAFFSDPELRVYLAVIFVATTALAALLWGGGIYERLSTALRHSCFNVVAVMTTTGFGTENFAIWPDAGKAILLMLMFVGGCSGSTGGGVKVIRFIVLAKLLRLEAERAFRPNLVRPLRIAGQRLDDSVGRDVLIYFCLIAVIGVASWGVLVAIEPAGQWAGETTGEKLTDCASAVAATLNNIGPGVGVCGPHGNFSSFAESSKLLLTLLMLLGRLELFAIIVLFIPGFWKLQ